MLLISFSLVVSTVISITCVFNEPVYKVLTLWKKQIYYEQLVPSFCFASLVFNAMVFVFNELKQSHILSGKNEVIALHKIIQNIWSDYNSLHSTWNQVDVNIVAKICVWGVDSTLKLRSKVIVANNNLNMADF